MWIFGYGSLIWKADFPYKQKISGYIKGYVRRFYQASTDHRGVPEKPGRVVTLLPSPDPETQVWGVAYEIADDDSEQVIDHLDFREKCGYTKTCVDFYPGPHQPPAPKQVFAYISGVGNKWFVGEADTLTIARQIAESVGPSGSNADYLFSLANSMRTIAPHCKDSHLFELERAVRNIMQHRSC